MGLLLRGKLGRRRHLDKEIEASVKPEQSLKESLYSLSGSLSKRPLPVLAFQK
jgi:hypothetical protein